MLGGVLEGIFILISAHCALAKDQLFILVAESEVASLFVVFGTFAAFHHERQVLLRKVRQNTEIETSPEVVRVGNEHVLVALSQEIIKAAGTDQSSVQVTVSRRTPFVGRIGGASGGLAEEIMTDISCEKNGRPYAIQPIRANERHASSDLPRAFRRQVWAPCSGAFRVHLLWQVPGTFP